MNRDLGNREIVSDVKLADAIRRELGALDFIDFERCVGSVLRSIGYRNVRIRREGRERNRNGGWDIDAALPTGFSEIRVIGQIKQYRSEPVQKRYVDELRGCMLRTNSGEGLLVTLSTFLETARRAAADGAIAPIRLIDGDELITIMIAHGIGVIKGDNGGDKIDRNFFGRQHHPEKNDGKADKKPEDTRVDPPSVTVVVTSPRPLRVEWKEAK